MSSSSSLEPSQLEPLHSLCLQLLEFDQSEFFQDLPAVVSMDTTGFIYVPSACHDKHTGIVTL